MRAEKTWPSIFVTAVLFKVSSLPAGTGKGKGVEGSGGEGKGGEGRRVRGRQLTERASLTAQQG